MIIVNTTKVVANRHIVATGITILLLSHFSHSRSKSDAHPKSEEYHIVVADYLYTYLNQHWPEALIQFLQ